MEMEVGEATGDEERAEGEEDEAEAEAVDLVRGLSFGKKHFYIVRWQEKDSKRCDPRRGL